MVLSGAVVTFFAVIAWVYDPWLEQAVAVEGAPAAWLQSSLLCASALLTLLLSCVDPPRRVGWRLLAGVLLCAALDERFMGHERLQDWLHWQLADAPWLARWAGYVPIAAYALGGVIAVGWLWRALGPGLPRRQIVAALAVGCAAIALDLLTTRLDWQIVEEALEALAETLWLTALLQHTVRLFWQRAG